MAKITVAFYADQGKAPALEWLLEQPDKVQDKFQVLVEQLEESGNLLRRPQSAPLRDKIHELRVRWQNVHYRLLYFFHGSVAAVVAHGCTKEDVVEKADIERAIARRILFLKNPSAHLYRE